MEVFDQLEQTTAFVRSQTDFVPAVGIVLGSGLGPLASEIEEVASFSYAQLPHMAVSTAPGHEGRLILGYLEGQKVVAYKGRVHFYEGYTAQQVAFGVRLGYWLGARTFMVTSAAGGLNPAFHAGSLMLHHDYLNFAAASPLSGPNDTRLGSRFPVTFDPYDPQLMQLVHQVARSQDLTLFQGTYAWYPGPQFASRAELRMLRTLGADAIGMSTVPEVLALRHLGARVIGLSAITDMAIPDGHQHATEQEVLEVAARMGASFRALVRGVLKQL